MLKWSVNTKKEKYVYFNKPVISGFGKIELSTVNVVIIELTGHYSLINN